MGDWANMQTAVLEWEGESWHCFTAKIKLFYSLYTLHLPGMQLQCKSGEGDTFWGYFTKIFHLPVMLPTHDAVGVHLCCFDCIRLHWAPRT